MSASAAAQIENPLPEGPRQLLELADRLSLSYTDVYKVVEVLRARRESEVQSFVERNAGKTL